MVENKLREYNETLVTLFSNPDIAEGRVEPAFRSIVETCVLGLGADRGAIWVPKPSAIQNETEYQCVEAFDRAQKRHSSGESLRISQYPNFFAALLNERLVSVPNTPADPRTVDLYNEIWKNPHVFAILCAPLWIRGQLGGFLIFDKHRPIPEWTRDQETFACQAADLVTNTILTSQSQELKKQLDLYETSLTNLTQETNPDTSLHELVRYAAQLLDSDCALLFVSDPRRQECCCRVSYNAPAAYADAVLKFGEDVAGSVAETGRTVLLQEYQKWDRRSPQFSQDGFTEVIAAPLRMGTKIRGVLELMRQGRDRPFVDWDRKMLEMLAKQTTVAFEQTRLSDRRTREEGHRKAVHQMVDLANQASDLSIMIDETLDLFLECVALKKGSIHVRPQVAGRGISPEEETQIYHVLDRDGRGFIGTIGVDDWQAYSGSLSELIPAMKTMEIQSSLFVPILSGSTYLGCICVHSPAPRTWSEMGVQQVQTMSKLIAICADKLTSHQYLDTHSRMMSKLNRINRGLNRLFSFDEALNLVGQGAVTLLETDQAAIFLRNPDGSISCPWSHGLPESNLNRVVGAENSEIARITVGSATTPLTFPDIKSSHLPPQFKKFLGADGVRCVINLPLIFSGQILGAISCFFRSQKELSTLDQSVIEAFTAQAAIAMQNAWMHDQMEQGYTDVALALARAMDARDSSVSDSSLQAAEWAEKTGQKLGLSDQEIKDLHWAALLHNIGRVTVPQAVLQKTGELNEEEWRMVHQTPVKAEELIQPLARFHNVGQIIRHSRERYDGNGYPDRRKGEEIPLPARILNVADAFTSMLDDRPYRKARDPEEAINELQRESGLQFDPRVVTAFVETIKTENGKSKRNRNNN